MRRSRSSRRSSSPTRCRRSTATGTQLVITRRTEIRERPPAAAPAAAAARDGGQQATGRTSTGRRSSTRPWTSSSRSRIRAADRLPRGGLGKPAARRRSHRPERRWYCGPPHHTGGLLPGISRARRARRAGGPRAGSAAPRSCRSCRRGREALDRCTACRCAEHDVARCTPARSAAPPTRSTRSPPRPLFGSLLDAQGTRRAEADPGAAFSLEATLACRSRRSHVSCFAAPLRHTRASRPARPRIRDGIEGPAALDRLAVVFEDQVTTCRPAFSAGWRADGRDQRDTRRSSRDCASGAFTSGMVTPCAERDLAVLHELVLHVAPRRSESRTRCPGSRPSASRSAS